MDGLCKGSKLFAYYQLSPGLVQGDFFSYSFPVKRSYLRSLNFPAGIQAIDPTSADQIILATQVSKGESLRFNGHLISASEPLLLRAHHQDGFNVIMPEGMADRSFVFDSQTLRNSCGCIVVKIFDKKGDGHVRKLCN